ncbi:MAG: tetratricopeptide repeat protein [Thermodesulfobacteriota bacterium]|nr:tetratricopeptide repeat protein [Thermodesulfobacteriota bacterium]
MPIDPIFHLVPADLERLGNQVIKWLGEVFPFSEWTFCPISDHVDGLPPAKLSERQRQRASQALSECKGFWDRIGQQVLIPIRDLSALPNHPITQSPNHPITQSLNHQITKSLNHQIILGTLVLFKVDNSIGPEEAERWLPVLQSWVENKLKVLRLESSFSRSGKIPPYVCLTLETIFKKEEPSTSLLHLIQKTSANSNYRDHKSVIDLCSIIWRHSDPEWLGGNPGDFWILLPGVGEDKLSFGLKHLISKARTVKMLISKAYGHHISEPFDIRHMEEDIYGLERLAEELGTAIVCTDDLNALENSLGLEELGLRLDQVKKVVNGSSKYAVAYIKPVPHDLKNVLGQDGVFILGKKANAFLIRKLGRKSGESDLVQWGNEVQKLCTAAQGTPSTIGIAAGSQPAVGPSRTPVAALWAFMHADLLGNGSVVIHDSLTWNVRGDKILSWGDLPGACRNYRLGLKTEPINANLLNSLGVGLAEQGRSKAAINAFSEAARTSPENFMAFYNLGGVFFQKGDIRSAEKALKKACALKPGDIRLAGRMAEVLIELNRAKEALDVLSPFVERHDQPISGAILRILGKAYMVLNQWQKAKASWQQAIKINHEDSEAMALLALGYLEETHDWKTATKLGRQAEALGIKSKKIRAILCRLNKKLNSLNDQK